MDAPEGRSRSLHRLADELDEDGIALPDDEAEAALVVEELDHARRTPMFEGRRPVYGAIVTRDVEALRTWGEVAVDLVEVPGRLDAARAFADGRASYLVRDPGDPARLRLACFERTFQFEAELVRLQQATGALVVQRTPVYGVSRLFAPDQVVSWNGRSWEARATAGSLLPHLLAEAPDLPEAVAAGVLDLAIHWLAPARAGATLVVAGRFDDGTLDTAGAVAGPALDVTDRRHYPPLLSCLSQRDLATLIGLDGCLRAIGVGLRSAGTTVDEVTSGQGMRHRSAQRWSQDHPEATAVVVSSDGPVTVYRSGTARLGAD